MLSSFLFTFTEDIVWYYLNSKYDYELEPAICGNPGSKNGLSIIFSEQYITKIPFRTIIEVPFAVRNFGSCNKFVDIQLQIRPSCEIATESSAPYQYGTVYANGSNVIEYLNSQGPPNVISALTSVSSFSLSWKSISALALPTPFDLNKASSANAEMPTWIMVMIVSQVFLILIAGILIV